MAGDGRVGRRGRRHRPEGIVAGLRAGHECSRGRTHGADIPQVVGVSVVECTRRRAHLRLSVTGWIVLSVLVRLIGKAPCLR